MSCTNYEYSALPTVLALLFPEDCAVGDKEANSAVHADQWMKQAITKATESPFPICSIHTVAKD